MSDWTDVIRTAVPVGGLMVFFWPLRKYIDDRNLHDWLRRFRGRAAVKTPMGEAAIEVAEQQGSSNNPASANLPAEPGAAMPGSQLPPPPRVAIQLIEDELRSDLEKIPQEARVPMLLRALADTRIRAGHEFVYNRIFGSQISALKALNERGPIPDHDAMREFEPLKTQFPEVYGKYEFGDWAGWLERMSMVTHQNGVYAITPLGRDFLFYLVDTGLTENKPL